LLDSSFLRFYEFLNNFTVQAKYLFIYTALEKKKTQKYMTKKKKKKMSRRFKIEFGSIAVIKQCLVMKN
jgi:hypothetical protein